MSADKPSVTKQERVVAVNAAVEEALANELLSLSAMSYIGPVSRPPATKIGPTLITPSMFARQQADSALYQRPKTKYDDEEVAAINRELAELNKKPQTAEWLLRTANKVHGYTDHVLAQAAMANAYGAPAHFIDAILSGQHKKDKENER